MQLQLLLLDYSAEFVTSRNELMFVSFPSRTYVTLGGKQEFLGWDSYKPYVINLSQQKVAQEVCIHRR
jgi:hypothetical protein